VIPDDIQRRLDRMERIVDNGKFVTKELYDARHSALIDTTLALQRGLEEDRHELANFINDERDRREKEAKAKIEANTEAEKERKSFQRRLVLMVIGSFLAEALLLVGALILR